MSDQTKTNGDEVRKSKADARNDLPCVDVDSHDIGEATAMAWRHLATADAKAPTLFMIGRTPVRMVFDGSGAPISEDINADRLAHPVGKHVRCMKRKPLRVGRDTTYMAVEIQATPQFMRAMLADEEIPLPKLRRITTVPVMTAKGDIVSTPGYHAASELFYAPVPGFVLPDKLPPVDEAVRLVNDNVLFDFPLAVDTARAHAFAYFLAPFVRDLVDGPVPMFVFSAPTPGTGKDLLSGGLAYPSLGHKLPTTTYDGEEAERRKTIFALLRDVPSHIAYNNVNRAMESTALKATLTQTVVEGRVLGVSEKLRLPNNAIWSATGNNVEVDAELLRRVLWVRLISDHEQPSQRSNFKHPDLMRWIASYRGELCAAALSIVSAWIAAGKPAPRVAPAPMGSFESFVSVMAGILAHAGIDGFRPVTSVAHEVSQEVRVWRVIVERWRERFPSKVVSAGELWSIVSEPEIRTALGIRDDSDNLMKAAWGRKLSKMVDRVFDGWRIKVADVTYSSNRYTLAETRVNP